MSFGARRWGRWAAGAWAVAAAVGAVVACGSSTTSSSIFRDGGADGSGSRSNHGDGATDGDHKLGSQDSGHLGNADGSGGKPGDGGLLGDGACAAHTTPAAVIPAYLIFVMDRSDSMHQYGKWPACSAALEAFFADPTTTGIYSSLTFMPFLLPDGGTASCIPADYVTPEVPITALPNATAFKDVIAAEALALGTPTTAALGGAMTYAEKVKAMHPSAKVLLVLATDGYPALCSDNSVADVAKVAQAAAEKGIPTYVIGVGPPTGNAGIANLNEVAEAGTTSSAFFIPTAVDGGDAGATEQAFLSAVQSIQGKLGCTYTIPPAPSGEQLNYGEVNVVLTSGGKQTLLPYSQGCTNPGGWFYDYATDGGTPEDIDLCPTACQNVKSTASTSSISVELGCVTSGGKPPP